MPEPSTTPFRIARADITGLVLAGGEGARMGRVDKGLQPFRGAPLITHAVARLAPQVASVRVSVHRDRAPYEALGYRVVADDEDAHEGPLAGIAAGLADCATPFLAAVPCDAPCLPIDLVARLAVAFGDARVAIVCAATPDRRHPVFCLMRATVAPALAAFRADGGRSARRWIDALDGPSVVFTEDHAFRNLNTLADLHDAG